MGYASEKAGRLVVQSKMSVFFRLRENPDLEHSQLNIYDHTRCQVGKVEAILRRSTSQPPRRNAVRTSVYLIQLSCMDAWEKNSSSILYMKGHSWRPMSATFSTRAAHILFGQLAKWSSSWLLSVSDFHPGAVGEISGSLSSDIIGSPSAENKLGSD